MSLPLTVSQAVLTLFNSAGAGCSPPAPCADAAADGGAETEHLVSPLSQVNLDGEDAPCDQQRIETPVDPDAAVKSGSPAVAGGDSACIRQWMQVWLRMLWHMQPSACDMRSRPHCTAEHFESVYRVWLPAAESASEAQRAVCAVSQQPLQVRARHAGSQPFL